MASGPGYSTDPEHRVDVRIKEGRWQARLAGVILADSRAVLVIHETGYPPAVYFPPVDVRLNRLTASETWTYCPFKGHASHLAADGRDVAWVYEQPYDEVAAIAGRVAFYTDHVDVRRLAMPRPTD
jgi:uncharacterized protein (DUF427 family)